MDTLTAAIVVVGFIALAAADTYIIRTARDISTMVSDVAAIQRAIFLQLRRQYQDIDRDLKEMDQDLKEVRGLLKGQKG